jgi:adenylate kinase
MSELNLILLGMPGAGKGTQADRLKEDFGLQFIGTGDLLRKHKAADTALGREAATYMQEGQLVPDDLVVRMILDEVEESGANGFLLDGFPRSVAQADALAGALEEAGRRLTAALHIEADEDVVVRRITGRRQCRNGHVYHVDFNPPKHEGFCDVDGTKLFQRDDDTVEALAKRLETYREQTAPLIAYYDERGLLRRFDGSRSPAEVHDHIRATLATLRLEERL